MNEMELVNESTNFVWETKTVQPKMRQIVMSRSLSSNLNPIGTAIAFD